MECNEASSSNFHSRSGFQRHSRNIVLFANVKLTSMSAHTLYLCSGWSSVVRMQLSHLNVHSTRLRAMAKSEHMPWLASSSFATYVFRTCLKANAFQSCISFTFRSVFFFFGSSFFIHSIVLGSEYYVRSHFHFRRAYIVFATLKSVATLNLLNLIAAHWLKIISDLCTAFKMKVHPIWRYRISR